MVKPKVVRKKVKLNRYEEALLNLANLIDLMPFNDYPAK